MFQAEDGIRDLVRSRGLGDVYKRQELLGKNLSERLILPNPGTSIRLTTRGTIRYLHEGCLLYTSDAADERSSVDLGGRRIIKKKNTKDRLE